MSSGEKGNGREEPRWEWVRPTDEQVARARADRAGGADAQRPARRFRQIPPMPEPMAPQQQKRSEAGRDPGDQRAYAGPPHKKSRRPRYIPRVLGKAHRPPPPDVTQTTLTPRTVSGLPRLCLLVEGQTEEAFVRLVLTPHLRATGIEAVPRMVVTSRTHGRVFSGGLRMYQQARTDLRLWMEEDTDARTCFTTMFDLYALPQDFPGYFDAAARFRDQPHARVEALETSFRRAIAQPRFIPYIQLYEYEALVIAGAEALSADFPSQHAAIRSLVSLRESYPTPEHINDGLETAPSKRIIHALPNYRGRKATAGPLVAKRTGLQTLRGRCPHFARWLARLEQLPNEPNTAAAVIRKT